MYKISKLIISLFGIGFFPFAPGTMATIISLIFFYLFLDYFSPITTFVFFIFLFFSSIKLIKIYSLNNKNHDASEIVIDEFLGVTFVLIFYEYFKFTNDILMFCFIFLFFRFFDIVKIFPANWIDKNIKNEWGVLLDDIVAGTYCIIILSTSNVFF